MGMAPAPPPGVTPVPAPTHNAPPLNRSYSSNNVGPPPGMAPQPQGHPVVSPLARGTPMFAFFNLLLFIWLGTGHPALLLLQALRPLMRHKEYV